MSQDSDRSSKAPLFVDTLALNQWLAGHFDASQRVSEQRLMGLAITLLECVTLALKDRDRVVRIAQADELLIRLRVLLRVVVECGQLTPEQYCHALERIDAIGAQIGAWKKRATQSPRGAGE